MSDLETLTAKQAAINAYTAAGYILFPCGNIKNEKAPRNSNWQDTTETPNDLPDIFGLNLQDDDFVLDFDPVRGEDDLVRLLNLLPLDLPLQTFIVNSGRDGLHVYFKMPPTDAKFHARVPGFPAVEIKVKGRLVVGCGSTTKAGRIYSPYRLHPGIVLNAPQELVDLCKVQPKVHNTDKSIETDDKGTQARFISYLMMPHQIHGSCYEMACEGKSLGLSRGKIKELILDYMNPRWDDPITPELLQTKIDSAFDHGQTVQGALSAQSDFASAPIIIAEGTKSKIRVFWDEVIDKSTGTKIVKPTMGNAVNYFIVEILRDKPNQLLGLLKFNEFTNQIEFTRQAPWHNKAHKNWKDSDGILLRHYLINNYNFDCPVWTLNEAIFVVAHEHSYNPVISWLDSLVWDGTPRLDILLPHYCGAVDSIYTRAIGKNTLIGACARAYDPGCQFDYMLILEGTQGIYKTKFVAALGGDWYGDTSLDPGNKDTIAIIQRGWIFEISELEGIHRSQVQSLKRFLTCKTDIIRMPYDRFAAEYKRHSILIGTTNPDPSGYLNDTTGNRRFWPVAVTKILLDAVIRDRSQLFAEAVYRYKKGESHYMDNEELVKAANEESNKRIVQEAWTDVIEQHLPNINPETAITFNYLSEFAINLPTSKRTGATDARIRKAMTHLGYKYGNRWFEPHKKSIWRWYKTNSLEDLW